MGTYTTNKNLFMPSVGEQGWGTLVNENFSTIDTFLKPITVSGSTYTFTGNQTGGTISATSITNSGTLTNTGKITANGGIGTTSLTTSSTITSTGLITANSGLKGNLTGNVTGNVSGSATSLNKTVTIGVSSTSISFVAAAPFVIGPWIYGVKYSGSVKATASWGGLQVRILTGTSWSTKTIGNTGSTTQSTATVTFSNANFVIVVGPDINDLRYTLWLPTYS